jgi:NAD(P)-dependent dehydrogenase (short-subunit alcohol dehydrogenase family)
MASLWSCGSPAHHPTSHHRNSLTTFTCVLLLFFPSSSIMSTDRAAHWEALHANPSGPGDARPTALSIVRDEQLVNRWTDKVIFLTGASGGIGVETARALHATGAHLFLPVRDVKKGEAVVQDILANSEGKGKIDLLPLDLTSLQSVRQCVTDFLQRSQKLNVLILNAAVMATPEGHTEDGFELQLGVNHIAHFLLFQLLKPTLLASSTPQFASRVVAVSSSAHGQSPVLFGDYDLKTRGYEPWIAYGQSKTANIYLATEIERRYGSRGLHANALHPGNVSTEQCCTLLVLSAF